MTDISTPTSQHLIGRLMYDNRELWYILTGGYRQVELHLTSKTATVGHILLPLSMDKETPQTIHIPSHFSKNQAVIPNEVTWEFLYQLYTPLQFPIL